MRRRSDPSDIEELNLVPIMNLVVCLIPMVLLGASITQVGVINSTTPRFCATGCGEPGHEVPLGLTVVVTDDGIRVSATGHAPLHETPAELAADDFVALYQLVSDLKDQFPEETLVNVGADARVPYRRVVQVLDVLRHRLDGAVEADTELRAADLRRDAQGRPELLFPDVTFVAIR